MNPNIDKEYQNIFRELKEEKMDWNFEDFLKKTEEKPEETKVIPLQKKSGGGSQKWYWMAASLATLFGMMMFFNPDITEPTLNACSRLWCIRPASSLQGLVPIR